jgi:diguanylate cyclase (GGDEF)-like protein
VAFYSAVLTISCVVMAEFLFAAVYSVIEPKLLYAANFIAVAAITTACASLCGGIMFRMMHKLAQAHQHVERASQVDALTELYNRGYFWSLGERRLREERQLRRWVGFILFDIDDFKAFNDRHGHLVGDAVLRHCAKVARHQLRDGDVIGRFGGEEFAVFLEACTPEEAYEVGECIRRAVAETPFVLDDAVLPVTVSVGVVCSNAAGSLQALAKRSDEAMYEAKRIGKNRTVRLPLELIPEA